MGLDSLSAIPLDQRAHPLTVAALYNANMGSPCVVIGGGPSALSDLEQIPDWQSMLQISANGHGFRVPGATPRYIFTKDNAECPPRPRKRDAGPFPLMEPQMRVHGVPIISIQYWGDYRCVDWPIQGNSGQHALAVAALMGSAPVIGVGFDCFQGPTYFHSDGPNVSAGHKIGYWQMRYRRFAERLRGGHYIRGVSGVLAAQFGKYDPAEHFAGGGIPAVMARYATMATVRVRTLRAFRDPGKATEIPAGYVMASNIPEARRLIDLGLATLAS